MLKNLLKTWWILAPDEVQISQTNIASFHNKLAIDLDQLDAFAYEISCIQPHLQRCIQARGWVSSLRIFPDGHGTGRVWIDDEDETDFNQSSRLPLEALLTAYMTALAAQRPVKTGLWRHFKGDVVEVVGVFPFGTRDCDDDDFTVEGEFAFEDDPTLSFQLLCWGDGHMEFQHTALSLGFLPDRVAYLHGGKGYLRLPDNFLDLVDAKHPEHEGLLRFVEVDNAGVE
jgi:hypothetical protein